VRFKYKFLVASPSQLSLAYPCIIIERSRLAFDVSILHYLILIYFPEWDTEYLLEYEVLLS
jgi:hypothetical protein